MNAVAHRSIGYRRDPLPPPAGSGAAEALQPLLRPEYCCGLFTTIAGLPDVSTAPADRRDLPHDCGQPPCLLATRLPLEPGRPQPRRHRRRPRWWQEHWRGRAGAGCFTDRLVTASAGAAAVAKAATHRLAPSRTGLLRTPRPAGCSTGALRPTPGGKGAEPLRPAARS